MNQIRAAGAIVCRSDGGELLIAVVHRPRYDDWSFPKGKAKRKETDEQAAVREVEEETGCTGVIRADLGSIEYPVSDALKTVRYFAIAATRIKLNRIGDEVDDLRWLDLPSAGRLLTYAHDREVLRRFVSIFRTKSSPGGS